MVEYHAKLYFQCGHAGIKVVLSSDLGISSGSKHAYLRNTTSDKQVAIVRRTNFKVSSGKNNSTSI